MALSLQWRHDERDGVSNYRRLDCLPDRLFRPRSKKTSKLRAVGLCEGNSPVTGDFPKQRTSNAENVSSWWRQHVMVGVDGTAHEFIIMPVIPLSQTWHWPSWRLIYATSKENTGVRFIKSDQLRVGYEYLWMPLLIYEFISTSI